MFFLVVKECATYIGECQVYQGNITCIPNPLSQAKRKSSTLGVILGKSKSHKLLVQLFFSNIFKMLCLSLIACFENGINLSKLLCFSL